MCHKQLRHFKAALAGACKEFNSPAKKTLLEALCKTPALHVELLCEQGFTALHDSLLELLKARGKGPLQVYLREIHLPNMHTKHLGHNRKAALNLLQVLTPFSPTLPETLQEETTLEGFLGLKHTPIPFAVEFRVLNTQLAGFPQGTQTASLPVLQAILEHANHPVSKVIILENRATYLSLLAPDTKPCLLILGAGYACLGLARSTILTQPGLEVVYQGDMDIDGFLILSRLRKKLALKGVALRSEKMTVATFNANLHLCGQDTGKTLPAHEVLCLEPAEQACLDILHGRRIEQEFVQ
ncbi:MAG: hypothetical protein HC848_06250 [Limnobacter sp.]|nr:hypothetical protein [Limnobacter sp.]